MKQIESPFWGASEAAAFLKGNYQTVCAKARNGELPARKLMGKWAFLEKELMEYVDALRIKPRTTSQTVKPVVRTRGQSRKRDVRSLITKYTSRQA